MHNISKLFYFGTALYMFPLWPWSWLSLQQKWVPGGKGGRCV